VAPVRIIYNPAAEAELRRSPAAQAYLQRLGDAIAADAREGAPKRTGRGAESIHGEVSLDAQGARVRVSWDREHFYMSFAETGTSHEAARPFLRPAAEKHREQL
jgi:HK97 gp10 family phage protein